MSFSSEEQSALIRTNDDAAESRVSAVSKGYFVDPFASFFIKHPTPRSPILNRGTYTRMTAAQKGISSFLSLFPNSQIVSLGAGSDTRYFQLKQEGKAPTKYFEIDLPEVTSKKTMTIGRNRVLKGVLGDFKVEKGGMDLVAADYALVSGNLEEFERFVLPRLLELGLDTSLPTLFLSECFLIYLEKRKSDAILSVVSSTFSHCAFVTYEQIHPEDAFGQMMIKNLSLRHVTLHTLNDYPDLVSQENRYKNAGFDSILTLSMNTFWDSQISETEKERITKLEFLDEMEEWRLFGDHYCIVYAWKGFSQFLM